eukprot:TRINITY_DN1881_c0_g1_i1.p1 TRINITY_DN1881_c0_g1~~TRINITY_DN1881_c0_g1_i1.p1  ORF type:complete len:645 (+),score=77.52 TRINITY_DN1881_c0_g1_i1:49-1935(+)
MEAEVVETIPPLPVLESVEKRGDNVDFKRTQDLLTSQHEALLRVLESWLASQEDRLSRLLENHANFKTCDSVNDSQEEASLPVILNNGASATKSRNDRLCLSEEDIPFTAELSMRSGRSAASCDDKSTGSAPGEDEYITRSTNSFYAKRKSSASAGATVSHKLQRMADARQTVSCSQTVVRHPAFEGYFAFLIVVNAIATCVEVHVSLKNPGEEPPPAFALLGHALGIMFFLELVVRVVAYGRAFLAGPDYGWNCFDIVLVVSWCAEFSIDVLKAFTNLNLSTSGTGLSNMRLFRVLRITRMFRLLRIARILRFVRALNLLVLSIMITLRSLVWATVLMIIIIFTFAIFICQSIADSYKNCGTDCVVDPDLNLYWGSLPSASLSLFQIITGGKDWDDLARPLMERSQLLLFILVVFITFSQFAVLNVVTGVFCQAAVESAQRDRELMVQSMLTNKQRFMDAIGEQFTNMFKQFSNGAGGLTLESFEEHVHVKSVREYFALLELDTSDAWMLFQLLDDDGSGSIDVEEFVDGCLKLKGTARSIDLARLSMEFKHSSQRFEEDLNKLRDTLRLLDLPALSDRASATVSRAASKGLSRAASKSSETIGGLGMGADTDIKDIVSRPQEYLSV